MSHPNKAKGDAYERAVREHCRAAGFVAERTRAGYARDHGDVHLGVTPVGPAVIAQVKNVRTIDLAGFLRDVAEQRDEAQAEYGFAVVKRRGIADVGRSYAVLELDWLLALLREAGYGSEPELEFCRGCGEADEHAALCPTFREV